MHMVYCKCYLQLFDVSINMIVLTNNKKILIVRIWRIWFFDNIVIKKDFINSNDKVATLKNTQAAFKGYLHAPA